MELDSSEPYKNMVNQGGSGVLPTWVLVSLRPEVYLYSALVICDLRHFSRSYP